MIWLVVLITSLAALVLLISGIIYAIAFHSPNRTQNDDQHIQETEQMLPLRDAIFLMIERLNAIPFERVSVMSYDRLRLQARYYHARDDAPLIIAFHGYRGTPTRDFAGGTEFYLSSGFNLLMIEERAHCSSEGRSITFGVRERRDCLTWVGYARERFGTGIPIVLAGISMGAATVLMASGLELPGNVHGVIADSPFTSPKDIILKVCGDIGIPPKAAYPLLALSAKLFAGFGLTDADASKAVRHAKIPILLIHGEDDRFVPCEMSRKIHAANPGTVELHTFPGAGHGLSFLIDRQRYEKIVSEYLGRVTGIQNKE